ncbi:MAG TPA: hypothetical protein VMV10_27315 [Pirellulales bacterium]|nr:hypothetical protein [Pirellulales bacterium]
MQQSLYTVDTQGEIVSNRRLSRDGHVTAIALSSRAEIAAVAHRDQIRGGRGRAPGSIGVYSLEDGHRRDRVDLGYDAASSVDVASGGGLLAYCGRHSAVVYNLITHRDIVLTEVAGDMPHVAFSPDAQFVAIARGDGSLGLFEVASGGCALECERASGSLHPLRFSRDGRFLAAVCDKERSVRIWEVSTGRLHRCFAEDKWYPYDLAFVPPGEVLASSGACANGDRRVLFWDVATGEQVGYVRAESEQPLAFSADGRLMASSGKTDTVVIWRLRGLKTSFKRDAAVDGDRAGMADGEFHSEWERLRSGDCGAAYAAAQRLIAAGDESSRRLAPLLHAHTVENDRLPKLFADLDADRFVTRRRASAELAALMPAIDADVQRLATTTESAEVRRALRSIQANYDGIRIGAPDVLRTLRAIGILERIGGKTAVEALQRLARGASGLAITQEATYALDRIDAGPKADRMTSRHTPAGSLR